MAKTECLSQYNLQKLNTTFRMLEYFYERVSQSNPEFALIGHYPPLLAWK